MNLTNTKILVCDDSILARKQLKDAINSIGEGAIFIDAKNGQEAVDLYKEDKADLCFLDIVMPVMDGATAVAEITAYDPDAKVIILSSVGTQAQLKKAIEGGAKDFIQKPLEVEALTKVMQAQLGGN